MTKTNRTARFIVKRQDPAGRCTYYGSYEPPIWTDDRDKAALFLTMENAQATADDFDAYYDMKDAGYTLTAEHHTQKEPDQ